MALTVRELMGEVTKIEELAKRLEENEEVTKEDKESAITYLRNYAADLGSITVGAPQ